MYLSRLAQLHFNVATKICDRERRHFSDARAGHARRHYYAYRSRRSARHALAILVDDQHILHRFIILIHGLRRNGKTLLRATTSMSNAVKPGIAS